MHLMEETLRSEPIYDGKILRLIRDTVRLENGKEATREVIEHPGGVCVVPLTEEGEVILVRQFRYPHRCVTLEIPAGKLERGEDPLTCGTRELREEAGVTAAQMTALGSTLPTPAYDTERIYLYLATGLSSASQELDADEFLDVIRMPLSEAVELVMRDEIQDAKTQVALLKAWILTQKKAGNPNSDSPPIA